MRLNNESIEVLALIPDPDEMIDKHEIEDGDGDSDEEDDTDVDTLPAPLNIPVLVTGEVGTQLSLKLAPQLHVLLVSELESQRSDAGIHQHLTLLLEVIHLGLVTVLP